MSVTIWFSAVCFLVYQNLERSPAAVTILPEETWRKCTFAFSCEAEPQDLHGSSSYSKSMPVMPLPSALAMGTLFLQNVQGQGHTTGSGS